MRSTVVTAALGLGLFAFGSQASAQIIATSIPKEVSAPAPSGPAGSVAPAATPPPVSGVCALLPALPNPCSR